MYLKNKNIHFIGIGGIGMCGLAELLYNSGCRVTGSDLQEGLEVFRLKKLGIPVFIGHHSSHIDSQTDIVVFSSAIKKDNVELQEAQRRYLTIIHRAEALAEMMRLKHGIVVAGSHGKTTTTAFLASLFFNAGKNPTVVAGGRLDLFQSTAHLGKSKWFIAESDESDGSFHHLFPELVVLTNIDDDHLDFYGSLFEMKKNFYDFLKKIPFYGAVIACGDCKNVREILSQGFSRQFYLYGFSKNNDFVLKKKKDQYFVYYKNKKWTEFTVPLKGDYNALNALGAMICAYTAGLKKSKIFTGLQNFKGVKRRREFKGSYKGCLFYDDYAHHPTELLALLSSFKKEFQDRRLIAFFQPHRYTRFQSCWAGFLKSFDLADILYVLPVYPAGEEPIDHINSQNFVKQIKHKKAYFIKETEVYSTFSKLLKEKDVFITLGAGSVYSYGESLLSKLKQA
ncbi:MAG: UDP-N-acetylmuramate--L-alanine ligase [Bdellovibrionales bacterium]|nr:UDP-N-acetylmuramate--L-alanine ligase [Bdellovibrionales bacterium]